jgi:Zn-dependent protease with chaperone function
MSFYLLGAALCLSVVFLVTAGSSVFCQVLLSASARLYRSGPARRAADLLFAIRVLPVVLPGVAALGFALPAFLKLEPHSTGEAVGLKLVVLSVAGTAVVITMFFHGARLLLNTARVRKQWRASAQPWQVAGCELPVYCVEGAGALLSVTGMVRPAVFVARTVTQILSPEELRAALAHEMAHVRSFDNLKQFLLKLTPQWSKTQAHDAAWSIATEVAADEEALDSGASILDLSSALIKIARLNSMNGDGASMLASHFAPNGPGSCVQLRVAYLERRLADAAQRRDDAPRRRHRGATVSCIILAALAYAGCLQVFLPWIHEALEMIVR